MEEIRIKIISRRQSQFLSLGTVFSRSIVGSGFRRHTSVRRACSLALRQTENPVTYQPSDGTPLPFWFPNSCKQCSIFYSRLSLRERRLLDSNSSDNLNYFSVARSKTG